MQSRLYNAAMDLALSLALGLLFLAIGVLINYLADVLPTTRRLSRPAWWPPQGANLRSYFLRPRVGAVLLLALLLGLRFERVIPPTWPAWQWIIVLTFFALVVVIDIEHRAILHPVNLAGAVLFGFIGLIRHGSWGTFWGGAGGFLAMVALYGFGELLGRALARCRGQAWEESALGFGDVNFAGVIGLLMGWPAVIGALFLAVVLAGIFSLLYVLYSLVRGRYRFLAAIPYAPFLALGVLALIFLRGYQ